jgi:sterol desaturase/sphingolipid hydroxylase (fatty acid hydroxylase superfamily)
VNEKYVALAIPFFFLLIGVENAVLRLRGIRGAYRFSDSITNLSCGVGQQVLEPFLKGLSLLPYLWLYSHARIWDVSPRSPLAWIGVLLAIDLAYYLFHRAAHRVGFLWAMHVVHHQSEEYNLTVALRQSWIQVLLSPFFTMPLALIGVPPIILLGTNTIVTLYQFWIHTRTIGRLGPLEWILNTPSHHRVHHGMDPEYLDKNYAGMFIIWDRLFGTFEAERAEPVYGTVKPVRSYDPIWLNVSGWADLVAESRETHALADKIRVWFAPPEWRPADLGGPILPKPANRAEHPRFDPPASRVLRVYVTAGFVLIVAATMTYLWFERGASSESLAPVAAALILSGAAYGALLERRAWAWRLEAVRIGASMALVLWFMWFGVIA